MEEEPQKSRVLWLSLRLQRRWVSSIILPIVLSKTLSFLYYLIKLHNEKEWNNQPSTSPQKTALTVESL